MKQLKPNGFKTLLKNQNEGNAGKRLSKSSRRKVSSTFDDHIEPHRFVHLLSNAVENMQTATENHIMVAEHNIALALCHKINVLFSVQTTFVNAERLAKELWTPALGGNVLDILVEGGELAYVPCQLLLNLTLYKEAAIKLLQDDVVGVICGVLRVGTVLPMTLAGVNLLNNLADHVNPSIFSLKMKSRTNVLRLILLRSLKDHGDILANQKIQVEPVGTDVPEQKTSQTNAPVEESFESGSDVQKNEKLRQQYDVIVGRKDKSKRMIDRTLDVVMHIIVGSTSKKHLKEMEEFLTELQRGPVPSENMLKRVNSLKYQCTAQIENLHRNTDDDEKKYKAARNDGYAAADI